MLSVFLALFEASVVLAVVPATSSASLLKGSEERETTGKSLEELPRKKTPSRDKTGQNTVEPGALEEARQEAIERIYASDNDAEEKLRIAQQATPDEILGTLKAVSGDKFKRLWAGEWWKEKENYPTQSEADLALCLMLASGTGLDLEKMETLLRVSGLYREKWDREDVRLPTLYTALSKCDRVYIPLNHYRKYKTSTNAPLPPRTDVPRKKVDLPDDQILEMLRNSKGEWGAKFPRLWEGDPSLWNKDEAVYKNMEAAQLGLCARLAFGTGNDEERIDRLFRRSGLYADNWEEESHRNQTIRKSLQHEIYNPDTEERDRILDELSELRLNLAWNNKNWYMCYFYDALITEGYRKGTLEHPRLVYFFDEEKKDKHVVVDTNDRDLQLLTGISSKGKQKEALRALKDEGLIKIIQREKGSDYSI